MIPQFLRRIASPVRGLNQAAYLLAALTLVSQILALLRDRLFAHLFGATATLDMYYAAFKIPDLVFALIASLVSAYVLIPRMSNLTKEESRRLLSHAASFLLIAGGTLSLILALAAPQFLFILFPTFANSPLRGEFILIARLLLAQPILLGLSGILGSVTQMHKRFILFALSPVLYNLGIILGTVFLYPIFGLPGIGIGVVVGALLHLLLNIPTVLQSGMLPRLTIPDGKLIWSVMRASVPRSLALGMSSLITLGLLSLASRLGPGAISEFTLGGNLEAVPLSLIGAAYATAAFPVLSELHGKGEREQFRQTLTNAARQVILLSSIILVFTIVLRVYIVRVILGSGAFGWQAMQVTAAVLALMVLSLVAQGIILLAARAFYAANRSWNPLFVQLADLGISVGSAWAFVRLAQIYPAFGVSLQNLFGLTNVGTEVLFVAAGFTVGQVLMGCVALATLRTVAPAVARSLLLPFAQALAAAAAGGLVCTVALHVLGGITETSGIVRVIANAGISGIVGITVTAGILFLLKNQEFREIVGSVRTLRTSRNLPAFDPAQAND